MRWVLRGAALSGVMGFFFTACGGGGDGGGTAGGGGSGGSGTGGAATGGGGGIQVGGASGASGASGSGGGAGVSSGGGSSGGGSAGTGGEDAGLPDVSFTYDPPDAGPDDACAAVTASATMPPVDVIWIIDQSCSMSTEIAQVKANVNGNFANIIQASGLDYRVIMFANSAYPTVSRQVCVLPPLGAATCGQNNPPKFFQVNRSIESWDSLSLFMNTTWWTQIKANLRPNAYKAFIEVTDDTSNPTTAAQFDAFLLTGAGAGYFGTAAKRNYVFHSIIGVSTPLQPTAPKTTAVCSTAVNAGPPYQDLSILTGGLRHPVCDTNYSTVFNNLANSIVKAVACELLTPQNSDAGVIDWTKVEVQYTPGGTGTPTTYPQVANAAACTGNGFYYDNPANPTKVTLCPTSCTTVSNDKAAKVDLLLGCLGS